MRSVIGLLAVFLACGRPQSSESAPTTPGTSVPVPVPAASSVQVTAPGASALPAAGAAAAIPAGGLSLGYEVGCALGATCVACWPLQAPGGGPSGPAPARVDSVGHAIAIGAGNGFACALRDDRTVHCWGRDDHGQVRSLDRVEQIAIGGEHACGRRDGGQVWCWGSGEVGQLGDGRRGVKVRGGPAAMVGIDDAIQVAAGTSSTCVVRRDGTVSCAGRGVPKATPVGGLDDVQELALGGYFGCARIRDGSVRCWGENGEGALGRAQPRSTPVALAVPGLGGVVRIAAGGATACAIARDGSVRCWGHDLGGFLGSKPSIDCVPGGPSETACGEGTASRDQPTRVPWLDGAVDVSLTSTDGCARFGDGSVRCWGRNARRAAGSPEPWAALALAGSCP